MDSWFVRMTAVRERLLEHNAQVEWAPTWVGEKRFGEWIENVKDWAISRERFWGTPLPVWRCECGHQHCIGSRAELRELALDAATVPEDLHRPYIDAVKLRCSECGGEMAREPFVMDCWFDSGCASFAQWHYPFAEDGKFEANFPVDYICEGVDQTRGWFYSLLAVATTVFDSPCYRSCLSLGLILDHKGKKMSKSRGNIVNPGDHFDREGADAVRWYMVTAGAPWAELRFDAKGLRETFARFFLTLWNTYRFHADYAALDDFDPNAEPPPLAPLDRWALSRLSAVVEEYTTLFEQWRFHRAARLLEEFVVDDVSNWYVRRSRRRLWSDAPSEDKTACQHTLHTLLATVCRLMAPIAPYMSDHIHHALAGSSVHLADWPAPAERDVALEEQMALVRALAEAGRRVRAESQRRQRLPCRAGWIVGGPDIAHFHSLLAEELNVESLTVEPKLKKFQQVELRPNFGTLGAKVKGDLPAVKAALEALDPEEGAAALEDGRLELAGHAIAPEDVDLLRVERPGFAAATLDSGVSLVLDMAVDDALLSKGLAREITRRVQAQRKALDLAIEDRIALEVWLPDGTPELAAADWEWVQSETRAADTKLHREVVPKRAERFEVDGVALGFTARHA